MSRSLKEVSSVLCHLNPFGFPLAYVQAGPVLRVACHHSCPLELETVGRQMVFLFFVSSYILSSRLQKSVWPGEAEYWNQQAGPSMQA